MRQFTACVAAVDHEKADIARQAGFRQETVRADALKVGARSYDVVEYSRSR